MTANPQQPRDRDGRFGNLPPQLPTAAPDVPRQRVELEDLEPDQIESLFRRLMDSRGIDPDSLILGPGESYQGVQLQAEDEDDEDFVDTTFRHRRDAHSLDEVEWARTYHVRFRNFDRRALSATKELFRSRPSQLTPDERHIVFKNWVNKISDVYGMERPTFNWDTVADNGGGGFYQRHDHSITMSPNHPSVITLIHETRHALQAKEKGAPMITEDVERDARAWSLSLYYKVRPNLLKRLVREGRVFHIDRTVFDEN
jgi:hypothetical protein